VDAARWDRVQRLFHEATDRPRADQYAFLRIACAGDETLVADVVAMLDEDAGGSSLLDGGIVPVAQRMMGGDGDPMQPPKAFGPYRITGILGEGGMGVVYRAEREDVGSVVAIKILRDAWLSPARRVRFASEQRTLAQLNHPSIARLYDAGTLADGTPWFVMECVDGTPLTEYCRTHESGIVERLRLLRRVCEAVQHAHQSLIIHRDLKPSNILVSSDGNVKLLDFGISKQIDSAPDDSAADFDARGWTRTGFRAMTPAYAAPEQLRGGSVGVTTDVYALGVVLYELLAAKLPFDPSNKSATEVERLVFDVEPQRPSAIATRGTGPITASAAEWADLDVMCLTAMQKEPARRYRSVEALVRDVDHYLNGEPLEARPDAVGYRFRKFVTRNRRALAGAAVLFFAIVSLVAFYTVRLAGARNAAVAQAARTQRIQRFMLNLFEGGDKQAGPADSLRVVTLIERGVKEARALAGDPALQAELYEALGSIYQKLGDFGQADTLLRSALDERRSLLGPAHADVAASTVALGLLRTDQAKFDEAERLVRDGLGELRRLLPPQHPAVAKATVALGKVLEDRGAYDQAIPILDEAVRLYGAIDPGSADLGAAIYELASVHFYAGHLDLSDSLNRRALELHKQLYGDRHPLVSDDLVNIGAVQYERGRYVEAEGFYRQALDITRAWYGDNHHKTAANLTMLGRALNHENRYSEALDVLGQAVAIRERVYGPNHPTVASTVNELGGIALGQKKYDDAERYFRRMIAVYRASYGEKQHYTIGIAVSNLGSVYLAKGDYGQAEPLFREAIDIYLKTLSADHLNTGIARVKLGRTLLRQQRYADAEAQSRAGYDILHQQMNPGVSWLQNARTDLIDEYTELKRPDDAAHFRAELASIKP
jgi:serine/threonine protein kinase/tetratricopeptide (TPR) repeat protein